MPQSKHSTRPVPQYTAGCPQSQRGDGGIEHAMETRRLRSTLLLRKSSDAAPDAADADELHSDDEPTHDRATLRPVEFAYNSVVAAAAAASLNNTTASLTGRHGFEGHRNSSGSGTVLLSSASLEWGVARVGEVESRRDRQQQQQHPRDVEDPSDAPGSANSNTSRNLDDNTPGSGYTSNTRHSNEGASTSVRNPTSDTSESAPSATESATSCSPGQVAAAAVSIHVAEPAGASQHPPASEIATMVASSIAEPIAVDTASPDSVAAADDGSRAGPHVGSRNVYVAALPLDFTESDLTVLLREFGNVKSCRMFNAGSRVDEIGRSYGFALFEDPSSAERAVAALDGKPMGNARMQCQLSRNGVVKKSKKNRASRNRASTTTDSANGSDAATLSANALSPISPAAPLAHTLAAALPTSPAPMVPPVLATPPSLFNAAIPPMPLPPNAVPPMWWGPPPPGLFMPPMPYPSMPMAGFGIPHHPAAYGVCGVSPPFAAAAAAAPFPGALPVLPAMAVQHLPGPWC